MSLIDHLKGRIAEALVESIFRHHRYKVSRLGRESHVQRLVKLGSDEFLPDFLVWKPAGGSSSDLHQMLTVEAKYRAHLNDFLHRDAVGLFTRAQPHWPNLYFVFVTDLPEPGRSCFQTVWLRDYAPGSVAITKDLHEIRELGIYRSTVVNHEVLAQQLFGTLRERMPPRRSMRGASGPHRLRA